MGANFFFNCFILCLPKSRAWDKDLDACHLLGRWSRETGKAKIGPCAGVTAAGWGPTRVSETRTSASQNCPPEGGEVGSPSTGVCPLTGGFSPGRWFPPGEKACGRRVPVKVCLPWSWNRGGQGDVTQEYKGIHYMHHVEILWKGDLENILILKQSFF